MNYIGLNLTAVLAASAVSILISALFHVSLNTDLLDNSAGHNLGLALTAFIAEFWLAAILAGALILAPVDADAWTITLVTPIVIWIGFVLPTLAVSFAAQRLKISTIALDCTHWLVVMVAQAAVLHSIGLVRQ